MDTFDESGLPFEISVWEFLIERWVWSISIWKNKFGVFFVNIPWCAIKENKESPWLSYDFWSGSTEIEAIWDFIRKISGRLLVLNAYKEDRREIVFPHVNNPSR